MPKSRSAGGSAVISRPAWIMRPTVGGSSPAMARSNVVLPQPDGPRNETNSPVRTFRLTRSRATKLPNCLPTSLIFRNGSPMPVVFPASVPKPLSRAATITLSAARIYHHNGAAIRPAAFRAPRQFQRNSHSPDAARIQPGSHAPSAQRRAVPTWRSSGHKVLQLF